MSARSRVGGQALGNGVMLRAGSTVAVAVRRPDGSIDVRSWERHRGAFAVDRVPVLRVLAGLSAGIGAAARALRVAGRVRQGTPGRLRRVGALVAFVVVAQALAYGLWYVLRPDTSALGAVRGAIAQSAALIAALVFARLTPYGRRIFMYHGAEHQAVRAHELGLRADVDPQAVAVLSPIHPRCGTHLALWLTAEAGALEVVRSGVFASGLAQFALLAVSLGVVAEMLRLAADSPAWWARVVRAPGSALQHLTTRRADAAHCEVALAALGALVPVSDERFLGSRDACISASVPSS